MQVDAPEQAAAGFRIRPRKSRRLPWSIFAASVVLAVATMAWLRSMPERVDAIVVARRDVSQTLILTGRVRPLARPRIGSNVAGTIRDVSVQEGQHVDRGQLLLRLDDAPQQAALGQARAALATAQGNAQANVAVAELAAEAARRDAERARALYAGGAISLRDREVAERLAAKTAAEVEAAVARGGNTARPALAEVARARSAVEAAEAQLALTQVRAAAPATVLLRKVEPGDAVLPGQVLLELALDGATELVAFTREENLAGLAVGANAVASSDAFPDSTFTATVSRVAPVVDPTQGTVEVRFAVPQPPDYLRADMTISVNVETARRLAVLVVPSGRIGEIGSGSPWVVLARDGRAVRQPVQVGARGERDVEILAGVTEADRVLPVTTRPGRRVKLVVP